MKTTQTSGFLSLWNLKHFSTRGSPSKKFWKWRNFASLKAIDLGETQEPTHISQESCLPIFSPGVHTKFWTFWYPLFCACWVHIQYNQAKFCFHSWNDACNNFCFVMVIIFPISKEKTLRFWFHLILALFPCEKRLLFRNFGTKLKVSIMALCAIEGCESVSSKNGCRTTVVLQNVFGMLKIY